MKSSSYLGWDGCRDRKDGNKNLPAEIQYEKPFGRAGMLIKTLPRFVLTLFRTSCCLGPTVQRDYYVWREILFTGGTRYSFKHLAESNIR
jgi:hypothetical protein